MNMKIGDTMYYASKSFNQIPYILKLKVVDMKPMSSWSPDNIYVGSHYEVLEIIASGFRREHLNVGNIVRGTDMGSVTETPSRVLFTDKELIVSMLEDPKRFLT